MANKRIHALSEQATVDSAAYLVLDKSSYAEPVRTSVDDLMKFVTSEISNTGGVSNAGDTTIQADSDANGVGEIALQIAATTHMILKNDGKIGIGTSAPDGVFEVHQAADGETKTLLVVRATDAGSPSGALIMGFNAAMDDEFWRFDANGSFQVVDIDGDNYINLYRGNDSVYINISRSTAAEVTKTPAHPEVPE